MIELRIAGCCASCDYINPELQREFSPRRYVVRCKHEAVCGRLQQEKEEPKYDSILPEILL